ncbi:MAG: TauD/TfdA family dioxygenase [Novosphingobium sp.]|jgi:taurine dioxygenase|nr:TauD/TfdA family dioxygenase [Novosphingobium sp.]
MNRITITRIAGALGAEIGGVDLGEPLTGETVKVLRQALLEHLVIFFRDQKLTPDSYLAFARAFGEPVEYPLIRGIEGYPTITEIVKLENERTNFGGVWHADTTYLDAPPMGSMLYALEVPPYGGDTLFANQYLAYETLSEPLRTFLDGLTAVNSSAKADVSRTREDMIRHAGDAVAARDYLSEHPVVRTHPETGRRSLYVNVAHTSHFKDMTEAESAPILAFLFEHQVRPEFTCRFDWRVGSLAFWDNRATQHNPINDYHGFRRVMRRITLAGEKPA